MMDDRDIRKKEERIKQLLSEAKPKHESGNVVRLNICGNNNTQAGRDVHINKREIVRPVIQTGADTISAGGAQSIQELVKQAVDIESVSGGEKSKLYSKWYSKIKRKFKVPSYRAIPAFLEDEAVSWMHQHVAKLRPKQRRSDNQTWRNGLYKAIWARSRQTGMSKDDVYRLVHNRLGKEIGSLKELGERDLKRFYDLIMRQ